MKKRQIKRKRTLPYNARSGDVPVLQKELRAVKGQISSLEILMTSKFNGVDKRFAFIESKFNEIDKRFELVDQRFNEIDKRFELVDQRFDLIEKKIDDFRAEVMASIKLVLNEVQKVRVQ